MTDGRPGRRAADGGSGPSTGSRVDAAYVFRVTVRLDPDVDGVWASPATAETTVFRRADPPGEPGWLYFRDNLWRGELGDPEYFRAVVEETMGLPAAAVDFRELRTSRTHLEALREAVAANLDLFNAATVDEALSKYLGSSIHVTDDV